MASVELSLVFSVMSRQVLNCHMLSVTLQQVLSCHVC